MDSPDAASVLIDGETALNAWLLTDILSLHVLFIFADFHAPSKPGGQMDKVVQALAKVHPSVKFAKLNAETSSDIAEQFEVSAVPTFCFFKNKAVIDRLEGADSLELTRRVERLKAPAAMGAAAVGALPPSITALSKRLDQVGHVSMSCASSCPILALSTSCPFLSRRSSSSLRATSCCS
jgi:thioredoxin-like negative regulator of GroEL